VSTAAGNLYKLLSLHIIAAATRGPKSKPLPNYQ